MYKFGLIGEKLTHSFSPKFFSDFFSKNKIHATYEAIEIHNINAIKNLLSNDFLHGFNVTIPYKKSIIPFLHDLSPESLKISAVNTVVKSDGKWIGHNTDIIGFEDTLLPFLPRNNALILGSGGASKAVSYVLDTFDIPFDIASRQNKINTISYPSLNTETISRYDLIINTTPVGMFPNSDVPSIISKEKLCPHQVVIDLIYNPPMTSLLRDAKEKGCQIANGEKMLISQALASWKIWEKALGLYNL